jgi:hypothetical protein
MNFMLIVDVVIVEKNTKVTELNINYNYAISSSVIFFVNVIVIFCVNPKYSKCHISKRFISWLYFEIFCAFRQRDITFNGVFSNQFNYKSVILPL